MKNGNDINRTLTHILSLKEWFWANGVKRRGEFELDPFLWLNRVYTSQNELELLLARKNQRPSTAIWGPSQTGKSTLVARYIDGVDCKRNVKNNALFWEGGKGGYFSLPRGKEPDDLDSDVVVLNPYNGGMDASACITRFTKGCTNGDRKGELHVTNPAFPVLVKFSNRKEILLSLARGYDGQCKRRYEDRYWTLDSLSQLAQNLGVENDSENKCTIVQSVYEEALDLIDVLEDLSFARLPRYQGLMGENKDKNAIRKIILSSRRLLCDASALRKFRNEILWDSEYVIGEFYEKLITRSQEIESLAKGRAIHCSLEVASCFLDMDCYTILKKNSSAEFIKGSKEERVRRVISGIKCQESKGKLLIGSFDQESGVSLLKNSLDFGIIQGLIQEIVIPLNFDFVDDSPFKNYLEENDLLDFPGVERGGQASHAAKIEFAFNDGSEIEMPWADLFSQVLKRGKTASLFQSYAKKSSLDAVSIFQDLDNDKPNANDLITGVEAWWRSIGFSQKEDSINYPTSLNCVMTWWAKMLNESPLNSSVIFGKNKMKYEQLGLIADPNVSNLFAINDFTLPRGKLSEDTEKNLTGLISIIKKETEFEKLFNNQDSQSSVDAMVENDDGGMDFFFSRLIIQVREIASSSQKTSDQINELLSVVEGLLNTDGLVPAEKSMEKERIKSLKIFDQFLEVRLKSEDIEEIKDTERSLKKMFNFKDKEIDPLPVKEDELNLSYLRTQIVRKGRMDETFGNNFSDLGFDSAADLKRCWDALCKSVEPDLKEMQLWLRRMVKQRKQFKMTDYRKFLAVRMSNEFISQINYEMISRALPADEEEKTKSPIIEILRQRLDEFMAREISINGRPPQTGDNEILEIRNTFEVIA